jgi:hypothetical protein
MSIAAADFLVKPGLQVNTGRGRPARFDLRGASESLEVLLN